MPKIFLQGIGTYNLGPMGAPKKTGDPKRHNSVKSLVIPLKDAIFYMYGSRFQVTTGLSYSISRKYDIDCEGKYCTGIIELTRNTQWKAAPAQDYKTTECNNIDPKCKTSEVTVLELMLFSYGNSWTSKIEAKYRTTNALGNCPPDTTDCSTKLRNCCLDTKMVYDEANHKWVRITVSPNPDTTFSDFTSKQYDSAVVYITDGGDITLDDSNYTVQNFVYFGGTHIYMSYAYLYAPNPCERFSGKGTLTFVGKMVSDPYLYGQPCGGYQDRGTAFLSTSWTSTSKLNLMPP
jgi:hypothetical protein